MLGFSEKVIDKRNRKFFKNLKPSEDSYGKVDKRLNRLAEKYGRKDRRLADFCIWKAEYYRDKLNYYHCVFFFKKALRIVKDACGPGSEKFLDCMVRYGRSLGSFNSKKSKNVAKRTLKIMDKGGGLTEEKRADIYISVSQIYGRLDFKNPGQRKKLLEEALKIKEEIHGEKSDNIITVLNRLSEIYKKEKIYEKAASLQTRILNIYLKQRKGEKILLTSRKLVRLLQKIDRYDKAVELIRDIILGGAPFSFPSAFCRDITEFKNIQEKLAGIYRKMNEYEKAEELYRDARSEKVIHKLHNDYKIKPVKSMAGLPVKVGGREVDPEIIKDGDLKEIRKELDRGAREEPWPLLYAADNGNKESAKYLIEEVGVDVDGELDNGITPLYLAVEAENIEIVKLLVEAGADISKEQDFCCGQVDCNIFNTAAGTGNLKIFEFLYEFKEVNTKEKNDALAAAAELEKRNIMEFFLEKGAEVTGEALLSTLDSDSPDNLDFLLSHGGNPDSAGYSKESTLLSETVLMGREKFVKILLKHGADVNKKVFHRDINAAVTEDVTPLMLSGIYSDNYRIARMLTGNGAKVDEKDSNGETALMRAAGKGRFMTASHLLKAGADKDIKNGAGKTVYGMSKENNYYLTTELLSG